MSEPEELSDYWKELIDDYLDGLLDEAGMQELENHLRADGSARDYFVRYARLHTDLCLEARAREAASRALERLERLTVRGQESEIRSQESARERTSHVTPDSRSLTPAKARRLAIAAGLLIAVVAGGFLARAWVGHGRTEEESAVAWLVNAQDCTWSDPGLKGNLQAGTTLKIERGLAEFQFQCGARIILEGPSEIQLLSSRSARLVSGKLTARVPAEAVGFEVLSPHGKVVDLGTEFGVRSSGGATEVYVFKGQVEAQPASGDSNDSGTTASARPARLMERQAAKMTSGTIRSIEPTAADSQFVRTIVAPPVIVPQTLQLGFKQSVESSIPDRDGLGTGLTHRLPGTGKHLAERDSNLHLNQDKSQLELTTTNSDLNTQYQLDQGEYFGVRLADLGFTGKEDFAVAVTIHNIPALDVVGQFGLYAGARSDRSIRGGLIGHMEAGQYTQFLVNNDKGIDTADICKVGLLSTGTDLRLTFKRNAGKFSLTVENLTEGSTSTLTIRHPDFLDEEKDLYVGLFGANTQSEVRKTLVFKDFQATVWTEKK
jgi:ferric-dicitrate binding protein FerR (iron transport regulator)